MKNRARRKQKIVTRPHGWMRATDNPALANDPVQRRHRRAPAGTSFLLGLMVITLAAIGIVRVRTTTQVLELGAEITELTDEHSRLRELRRRLSAERAYLRHPDRIGEVARDRLGMVPVAPELVQEIRVLEEKNP